MRGTMFYELGTTRDHGEGGSPQPGREERRRRAQCVHDDAKKRRTCATGCVEHGIHHAMSHGTRVFRPQVGRGLSGSGGMAKPGAFGCNLLAFHDAGRRHVAARWRYGSDGSFDSDRVRSRKG